MSEEEKEGAGARGNIIDRVGNETYL